MITQYSQKQLTLSEKEKDMHGFIMQLRLFRAVVLINR